MGKLGSTVLLDPMPCSKDETTKILFQEGEQELIAIANREDPSVSKTINVCEAKTGDKLNSKEMRKKGSRFDEFEDKMKVFQDGESNETRKSVVKMGGNTTGSFFFFSFLFFTTEKLKANIETSLRI